MNIKTKKTTPEGIAHLRRLFLQEGNFQVRYEACHTRNWSDAYLLTAGGQAIGYGSVKGKDDLMARDAVFEFFVLPPFRQWSRPCFSALLESSGAAYIECQSNDPFLSPVFYEFAENITSDTILFQADRPTQLQPEGVVFRSRRPGDQMDWIDEKGRGKYVLEYRGQIVGTGDFLLHYNMPFADIFMEARKEYRNRGFGAYLVQELQKACYLSGRAPGARCRTGNEASRRTLLKAGMRTAGYMLAGNVRQDRLAFPTPPADK